MKKNREEVEQTTALFVDWKYLAFNSLGRSQVVSGSLLLLERFASSSPAFLARTAYLDFWIDGSPARQRMADPAIARLKEGTEYFKMIRFFGLGHHSSSNCTTSKSASMTFSIETGPKKVLKAWLAMMVRVSDPTPSQFFSSFSTSNPNPGSYFDSKTKSKKELEQSVLFFEKLFNRHAPTMVIVRGAGNRTTKRKSVSRNLKVLQKLCLSKRLMVYPCLQMW